LHAVGEIEEVRDGRDVDLDLLVVDGLGLGGENEDLGGGFADVVGR
jgi:hypothetical protein